MEKRLLAMQLTMAQKALPADDPFLAAALGGRSPEVVAEALVNGTKLGSAEARKALLDGGAAADPSFVPFTSASATTSGLRPPSAAARNGSSAGSAFCAIVSCIASNRFSISGSI